MWAILVSKACLLKHSDAVEAAAQMAGLNVVEKIERELPVRGKVLDKAKADKGFSRSGRARKTGRGTQMLRKKEPSAAAHDAQIAIATACPGATVTWGASIVVMPAVSNTTNWRFTTEDARIKLRSLYPTKLN